MSKTTPKAFATQFLNFVNASPTQFHAVSTASKMLEAAGYTKISEGKAEDFKSLKTNGKYYFTRNQSSLVAFSVGGGFKPTDGAFTVMGAHTDSPVPKLKPKSQKTAKAGMEQVGVELYGGGLWNTWFDRDLSIAGKVLVRNGDSKYQTKLATVEGPILKIPNLAIHLNREIYTKGFNYNKEEHVVPVFASSLHSALALGEDSKSAKDDHSPLIVEAIAKAAKVDAKDIVDFEMCLYDTQPAQIGGLLEEFIFSRALDNLMMSFISVQALIDTDASLADEKNVRVVVLFDNEEVGSKSEHGADSEMFPNILRRIHAALTGGQYDLNTFASSMRNSILLSADMAHAVHPNYVSKHESNHAPQIHGGLVIKQNANQRYATTSITTLFLTELARKYDIPVQKFVVRNDSACGSTIGPALSAGCGIRTVDVGIPQWGMHSVRETCGVDDVHSTYNLFKHVFEDFHALNASLDDSE